MATLTEIREAQVEYEPTVQDKIQRVLYRLDQGEELIACSLKKGDQFCIMGLFLDVYGFDWSSRFNCSTIRDNNQNTAYSVLEREVRDYFNFRYDSQAGALEVGIFDPRDLPIELRNKLLSSVSLLHRRDLEVLSYWTLMRINDALHYGNKLDSAIINSILADIIRSGVIFNRS